MVFAGAHHIGTMTRTPYLAGWTGALALLVAMAPASAQDVPVPAPASIVEAIEGASMALPLAKATPVPVLPGRVVATGGGAARVPSEAVPVLARAVAPARPASSLPDAARAVPVLDGTAALALPAAALVAEERGEAAFAPMARAEPRPARRQAGVPAVPFVQDVARPMEVVEVAWPAYAAIDRTIPTREAGHGTGLVAAAPSGFPVPVSPTLPHSVPSDGIVMPVAPVLVAAVAFVPSAVAPAAVPAVEVGLVGGAQALPVDAEVAKTGGVSRALAVLDIPEGAVSRLDAAAAGVVEGRRAPFAPAQDGVPVAPRPVAVADAGAPRPAPGALPWTWAPCLGAVARPLGGGLGEACS